jgi:hypothetical protein
MIRCLKNIIFLSYSAARDLQGMGPLMYVGVGRAYTSFHEDGSGTVDSGHLCLCGFNEVIILRRLEGREREEAARILGFSLVNRPHDQSGGAKKSFHGQQIRR